MKPTIYITANDSLPEQEYREQIQAAESRIRALIPHAAIINPLKLGIPDSWREDERVGLRLKVMKQANAVVFLTGWINGPIAKREYYEANHHNKDIFTATQLNNLRMEYGHLVS